MLHERLNEIKESKLSGASRALIKNNRIVRKALKKEKPSDTATKSSKRIKKLIVAVPKKRERNNQRLKKILGVLKKGVGTSKNKADRFKRRKKELRASEIKPEKFHEAVGGGTHRMGRLLKKAHANTTKEFKKRKTPFASPEIANNKFQSKIQAHIKLICKARRVREGNDRKIRRMSKSLKKPFPSNKIKQKVKLSRSALHLAFKDYTKNSKRRATSVPTNSKDNRLKVKEGSLGYKRAGRLYKKFNSNFHNIIKSIKNNKKHATVHYKKIGKELLRKQKNQIHKASFKFDQKNKGNK